MRFALSSTLVAVLLLAGSAGADDSPGLREARIRYKEGIALYKRGKSDEAYTKFAQAYAVLKNQEILYNLAQTEYLTGRLLDANTHFRLYIKNDTDRSDQGKKLRDVADKELADLASKLGHIFIEAPNGAHLTIDGQPLEETAPLTGAVDVLPGTHSVEATIGDKRRAVAVTAVAGSPTAARLTFDEPAQSAPPPAPAPTTTPSATARDTTTPPPPSESFWTTRRYIGVAVTGAGLVMIGMSFYFGGRSNDDADRASSLQTMLGNSGCATVTAQCSDLRDAHDSANRNQTFSVVFGAAGIAAAAAGVALIVWPRSNPSQTAVAPMISPSSAGLQLHGAF